MTSGADTLTNIERAQELVSMAAGEGATYVQLPELFNYLGPPDGYRRVAEPIPGPTTERFGALAREFGVTLHLGSMLESSTDSERPFNTGVVLDPFGEVAARYRKIHLFDIDVPGEVFFEESMSIAPGDDVVVFNSPNAAIGLSICFDLRFPELYRALAARGATVLAIPSAFNAVTGAAHWEVLIRARAIENHAFVVAAAQADTTAEGIATYGHSMIVGPWGETLAESTTDGEDVLIATLDLDDVARRRSQIDVLRLRRPDVSGAPRRVTQEQAILAQDALRKVLSFEEIFGPPGPLNGRHLRKSVGVTADPPDYLDHYIRIVAPLAIDVSPIPAEIDGVRIVVIHEDLPGFRAL